MSLPETIIITDKPNELLHPPGFPFCVALIPGDGPLPEIGARGVWLIDADCGHMTLNDTALNAYLDAYIPVTLHAEKLRDLRPFLRRKVAFKLRGYRIEVMQ